MTVGGGGVDLIQSKIRARISVAILVNLVNFPCEFKIRICHVSYIWAIFSHRIKDFNIPMKPNLFQYTIAKYSIVNYAHLVIGDFPRSSIDCARLT